MVCLNKVYQLVVGQGRRGRGGDNSLDVVDFFCVNRTKQKTSDNYI